MNWSKEMKTKLVVRTAEPWAVEAVKAILESYALVEHEQETLAIKLTEAYQEREVHLAVVAAKAKRDNDDLLGLFTAALPLARRKLLNDALTQALKNRKKELPKDLDNSPSM